MVWFFVVKGKGGLLKTQEACLWGLVKPCQVRAPAEMLEVGGRGGAVGIVSCICVRRAYSFKRPLMKNLIPSIWAFNNWESH
ncbi:MULTISPECIES: hypothetical protein [unclassified Bartonella]|uniref:hypothetical protein n=1 Tax=unclassified Bartonella TaxID=2645622 RepID=UPI0035D0C1FE